MNPTSVISIDQLNFVPFKDKAGVEVADIKWYNTMRARVFKYPRGYETPLHILSENILHVILKGKVEFEGKDGPVEIAKSGMFHVCSNNPWRTKILEETYFLVIEKDDTQTIIV